MTDTTPAIYAEAERRAGEVERDLAEAREKLGRAYDDVHKADGVAIQARSRADAATRRLAEAEVRARREKARVSRLEKMLRDFLSDWDKTYDGPPEPHWNTDPQDRLYHRVRAYFAAAPAESDG